MKKTIIIAFLLALTPVKAAIESKLAIDQELFLSDKNGVVKAAAIAKAAAGTMIKLYKTDGTFYTGVVSLVKEDNEAFEIQGTINNCNASFGFKLIKGGSFVGAVVEHEAKKTYVLEFSLPHKGFILVQTLKYNVEA
jgi:hypothetical protein